MLSVVIPAYNEETNIERAAEVVGKVLCGASIEYEIVFVDDGSKDSSWQILKALANRDKKVKALRFTRNFGKDSAILAGMKSAKGSCVAVLDCDLQFPPYILVEMYKIWQTGQVDIVHGKKMSRGKEKLTYKLSAALFYKLLKWMSKLDLENASDFKLMDRAVVDAIVAMPERNLFFRGMADWVGYRSTTLEFEVQQRENGNSRWSFSSLLRLAINAISSYSSVPMQIVTVCGTGFLIFALVMAVQTLYMKIRGHAVEGFTTVILLLLIFGAITMLSLGIIGIYLSKIYNEICARPRYIVMEEVDSDSICEK